MKNKIANGIWGAFLVGGIYIIIALLILSVLGGFAWLLVWALKNLITTIHA
ncbi:MAG: hypothetical protein IKZ44_06950 [Clostridia bacterium]|nr:hypothetical protein [Clostridia bacterium]